ncbi:MAG TPA: preprotein translocase subunit SecY, partial [Spirochaetia bacterium]|nr:preprotein translocase subunit SecY [Spirochaetia bacterium]
MASNPFLDILRIKDLRDRILFTVGVLVIFRLGAILPIPGININALKLYFMSQQNSGGIGIVEYINFFSGGAFLHFSV